MGKISGVCVRGLFDDAVGQPVFYLRGDERMVGVRHRILRNVRGLGGSGVQMDGGIR